MAVHVSVGPILEEPPPAACVRLEGPCTAFTALTQLCELSCGVMAEERSAKRRRLTSMRRSLPHMSASALAAVLAEIHEHGLPERISRWDIGKATQELMEEPTPYGPLLQSIELVSTSGKPMQLQVANFLALLSKAFAGGGGFTAMLQKRLDLHPCSPDRPWKLALYADEVVPGNPLSNENRRKIWVVYVSFLELGPAILSQEDSWFCLATLRSREVNRVAAGMGQIFRKLLKSLFGHAAQHDLSAAGVRLVSSDGTAVRLWAVPGMFLQDGAAHKSTWHCKGDAGTKLCMLCRNLMSEDSGLVDEDGTNLLTCTLVHESELDFATDADIRGSVRRLAARHGQDTQAIFEKRQQAFGFRHEPEGLLLDSSLDGFVFPASQFVHDFMHAVFVNGVLQTTIYLVFEDLAHDGAKQVWSTACEYVALWTWPSRVANSSLADIFSAKRATASRKARHLKCTASEGLSVYPVLAFLLQKVFVPAGISLLACRAFLALADALDLLVAVPLGVVSPTTLRNSIGAFLDAFVRAGWKTSLHPKYHWMLHLPQHLARFKQLPTCWTHERKHRLVKRYASDMCNTLTFELSVLREITAHHLWALKKVQCLEVGLLSPREPSEKVMKLLQQATGSPARCLVSTDARSSEHITSAKGDVVLIRNGQQHIAAGEIWLHFETEGKCMSIASLWVRSHLDLDSGAAEWTVQQNPVLLQTSAILTPIVHTRCREGVVRTLLPCHLRSPDAYP